MLKSEKLKDEKLSKKWLKEEEDSIRVYKNPKKQSNTDNIKKSK